MESCFDHDGLWSEFVHPLELAPNDQVRQRETKQWAKVIVVYAQQRQVLVLLEDGRHIDVWPNSSLEKPIACFGCGRAGFTSEWVIENCCDACSNYGAW